MDLFVDYCVINSCKVSFAQTRVVAPQWTPFIPDLEQTWQTSTTIFSGWNPPVIVFSYWFLAGNGLEWGNEIIITIYCGSFPHSLLSTSIFSPMLLRIIPPWLRTMLKTINQGCPKIARMSCPFEMGMDFSRTLLPGWRICEAGSETCGS